MRKQPRPYRQVFYGQPVNWKHPLNRGLVSWWRVLPKFAGGLRFADLCHKNQGTLAGPAWSSPGRCSLSFDGVNDTVSIANEVNFDFERTNAFSVSCLFRQNNTTDTAHTLVSKRSSVAAW